MVDYHDYQLPASSRVRENVEWLTMYRYNENDHKSPRVLLIGDSICRQYHDKVRDRLAEYANVSFIATSKCVTDPEYLREIDLALANYSYSFISFNNGLHSLTSDEAQWQKAFGLAVSFLRDKCPDAKLSITLCTPVRDAQKNKRVEIINTIMQEIAREQQLPAIDLYTPMKQLDPTNSMADAYHWMAPAISIQADIVADHIKKTINPGENVKQTGTELGPDGRISL